VTKATAQLAAGRERFLRIALARATTFHRALDADSASPDSLRLYLFGGDCEDTLDAALIIPTKKPASRLLSSGLHAPSATARYAIVPGSNVRSRDGRVTRRSLFGLRLESDLDDPLPQAMKQRPYYAVFDCEIHGDLPLNLRVQNNLMTMLLGNSY